MLIYYPKNWFDNIIKYYALLPNKALKNGFSLPNKLDICSCHSCASQVKLVEPNKTFPSLAVIYEAEHVPIRFLALKSVLQEATFRTDWQLSISIALQL